MTICPQCAGSGAMTPVADENFQKDGSARQVYPLQALQPCSQCKGKGYYQHGMGS
jgi:DnaJ-class molecular chaperone